MTPSVTILLPVYNAMPYLPAAVESILGQTHTDWRLLIVNDGSTDAGSAYIDAINDPRVQVVHRTNHGLGATLNYGLSLCGTKYLARMDADDIAVSTRLEIQLKYMEQHPRVVMLGTQFVFMIGDRLQSAIPAPLDHRRIEERLLTGKAGVCHPTILVRTSVARAVGGYRIKGAGEDVDFCLRMCERGEAANVPDMLHKYRLHLSSLGVSRCAEIRRGYAYAIETARCRREGRIEPDVDAFFERWDRRGRLVRALEELDDWSGLQYRRARIDHAEGRRLGSLLRIGCAALCRPRAALHQLPGAVRAAMGRLGRSTSESSSGAAK